MDRETEPSGIMGSAAALRRLAEARDRDAWRIIVERHGPEILAVARRSSRAPALCEDVCQETLLQVRAHANRFQAPSPPQDAEAAARGWILRIACRTALRMNRGERRDDQRAIAAAASAPVAAPSAAEVAAAREEWQRVRTEVSELPELLREPLSLRFFAAMEYADVGTVLGCSEDAAKKRVHRGLEKLRARLASAGVAVGMGLLLTSLSTESAAAENAPGAVDAQTLADWQGLLESSREPALAGGSVFSATTIGGAVMAKWVWGAAAVLLCGALGGTAAVGAARMKEMRAETEDARKEARALSERIASLETRATEQEKEYAALQAEARARASEVVQLRGQFVELKNREAASGTVATVGGPLTAETQIQVLPKVTIRKQNGGPPAPGIEVQDNNVVLNADVFEFTQPANGNVAIYVDGNGKLKVLGNGAKPEPAPNAAPKKAEPEQNAGEF